MRHRFSLSVAHVQLSIAVDFARLPVDKSRPREECGAMNRSICVYCGSNPGNDPAFVQAAEALGAAIAEHGCQLVYGGGGGGIMGAVSRACLAGGGRVVGVIPEFLADREATRADLEKLSEVCITANMHERKSIMFARSDAFVALPGGIGTLEELVEIMTWAQLGRHEKPIVVANVNRFWQPLRDLLDHMGEAGFIHSAEHLDLQIVDGIDAVLPAIDTAIARRSGGRSSH